MTLEEMDRVTAHANRIRHAQNKLERERERLKKLNAAAPILEVKILLKSGDTYGNGALYGEYSLPRDVLVQQQIYAVMKAERELIAVEGAP